MRAELGPRPVDELGHEREVGHVARHHDGPPAQGPDLLGDLLELRLGAGGDGDVGPRLHVDERAQPAPIPLPAPVTTATWPSSRKPIDRAHVLVASPPAAVGPTGDVHPPPAARATRGPASARGARPPGARRRPAGPGVGVRSGARAIPAQLADQPQQLEVQPHQRDDQAEGGVPLHVRRGARRWRPAR